MKKYLSQTLMALSISAITANVAFAVDGTPSVTLFEHNKFNSVVNGAILGVTSSIPKLKDTILGNDKLSSIQVPQGCTATLYENNNFNNNVAGISQVFTSGILKLIETDMGNDTVSSVEVSCQPIARGIALFENGRFNANLPGVTEAFGSDDPDLENNAIGINRVSSIKVDEGCSATLYTEKNFAGDSVTITEDTDLRDLTNPAFGHDNVSSIKVSCASLNPLVVNNDTANTEDTPVTIDVLVNDAGNGLTLTNVSQPANGTASIVNGEVVYTPTQGFVGNDTFTYTVTDSNGAQSQGTVQVTVTAAPEPLKVILYHDHDQSGISQDFPTGEYRSFYNEDIGNNTVSSVHIPEGCSIDVFRDPEFDNDGEGDHSMITLTSGDYNFPFGDPNDKDNLIGDNHASSMKVDCGTDSL